MFQPRSWELSFLRVVKKKNQEIAKFSCLWFMPSKVLNMREEMLSERSKIVKGKRMGPEIFRQLSCKVCRRTLQTSELIKFRVRQQNHNNWNEIFQHKKGAFSCQLPFPTPPRLKSKKKGELEDFCPDGHGQSTLGSSRRENLAEFWKLEGSG